MLVNVARASVLLNFPVVIAMILAQPLSAATQPLSTPVVESREELEERDASTVRRKMDWNLEFAGEFEGEGRDESLAVVTGLGLDLRFQFSQQFALVLAPNARFYSARSQERFDSDSFEDRISLREAFMSFEPLSGENLALAFKVGSLSQRMLDQPQLISATRSFPAAMIETQFQQKTWGLSLAAEEAVPTSYTYNALREDKEPLPGLRAARAAFRANLIGNLELKLAAGQMNWRNLPSRVAFNSQKLGNTPQGELAPTSRFRTGFTTGFLGADLNYCLDCRWGASFQGRRSRNSAAPSDSADAQMWGLAGHYRTRSLTTSVAVDDFFAESDVTPASYAPSSLGNTNRRGQRLRLEFDIPSMELKILTQWVQARTIAPTPYQNDFNSVYLGVETHGHWIQ